MGDDVLDTGTLLSSKNTALSDDEDFDIFANTKIKRAQQQFVIPENAPVLPSMASRGEVELVVKDDGMAIVLFDTALPDAVHWVEYDMDLDSLTFVTWRGSIFSLGIKIHRPFRKYLSKRHEIYLIQMNPANKSIHMMDVVPMVTRRIGI